MIKFFRKIRQRLLTENKFGKYLLYAIGEILLIVIGLFIAIQLNNINQNNTVHKNQIKHLENIKSEMINNLKSMNELGKLSLEIMDAERKIITYIDLGVVSENELTEQLRIVSFNELIVPFENGALKEIISSGGLKDIENDSIRSMLASWEGKNTSLRSQEKQLAEIRNAVIALFNDEGSIRILNSKKRQEVLKIDAPKRTLSNLSLLKLRKFENTILHHMMLTYYLRNIIYPELENEINNLVTLIDKELSKSKK
jgi:hypothetical protein